MSTIYKHLIDEDLRSGKSSGVFFETERTQELKLRSFKIAIFILFIFSAAAFAGTWMIYQQWNSEKALNKKQEAEQIQLQDKALSFDSEAQNLNGQIDDLRQKLELSEANNLQLKDRLTAQASDLSAYQSQISELQLGKNVLEEKVRELEDKLSAASPVMKNYGAEISKESVSANTPLPDKQSKILTINRRFNFVVINLGLKDRLRVGDKLAVEKDGQEIGTVEVEKAYDHFSAATIIKEGRKTPFQEGNSVRRL
jgi:vacuolar-type H+-ATPase subunit I/STV1